MKIFPIFENLTPMDPNQRLVRAAIGGMIAVPIVATVFLYITAKRIIKE